MTSYRLYCFAQSGNAYKVALYLNCCGIEWEAVFVDFFHGATRAPTFRSDMNPMGEIPVLELDGKKLTQSGAILTLLAERTGKFAATNEEERYEVLRWLLFDNHKFTNYLAMLRFLKSFAPKPADPAVMAFLRGRTEAAYAIVEQHLASHDYMVGGRPTIADFSLAGYVYYPPEESGFDIARDYPNMHAWRERLRELAGFALPYDLLPGERLQPLR